MCEIKQIQSANEDVPPQWCSVWYMQALKLKGFLDNQTLRLRSGLKFKITKSLQICFMEQNGATDELLMTCFPEFSLWQE